ncbi:MAG: WecB/TagA/CpsF family glycosyltransferase [Candidatus Dormibacteria bacterium]|jgi:exopolysaccharide biosynthesis WecB/TagA/CpsF family protein
MPRLALVHDWLDRPIGGGERVLLELARLYPEAPVYTLLFDPGRYAGRLNPARVRTSWLQRLPASLRGRPRYLLPLIPAAVESWDLSGFDVVVSSSVAFVKNVVTPATTLHVCYCHSPMRFAWDYWPRYVDEMGAGPLKRLAVTALVSRTRRWDLAGATGVDAWMANSETTAARLRHYYHVDDVTVIPPPVDVDGLRRLTSTPRGDHWVTLSTLTEYKRIDLAVRAFNASGRPLVVIGDGPDRRRLERLAGPSVRFAGHLDDTARADLLASARALVFPGEEDFGIAAVEALACGTPVVAYGRGGLTEIVTPGRTGVFFDEESVPALNAAVERLMALPIGRDELVAAAESFAAPRFRDGVRSFVERAQAAHLAGGRRQTPRPEPVLEARVRVLGVPVDPLTVAEAVTRIAERAADPTSAPAYVIKPYVEFFGRRADSAVRRIFEGAWLSLADGVAVQWAAAYARRRQHRPADLLPSLAAIVLRPATVSAVVPERVAGVTLTLALLERCREQGLGVFLIGSPKHNPITRTARHLERALPGLRVLGTAPGRVDPAGDAELLGALRRRRPDIILVGLGFPAQERLMARLAPRLDHGVLVGEGGSFDYRELGGDIRRAPGAIRRLGLEWLWRLLREPWRLRRQLAIPQFVLAVQRQARRRDARTPR